MNKTQFYHEKKTLEENNYLAISAYLHFLTVIPRVEQMMCKLKRNAFFPDPLYLKHTSESSRSPVLTFFTPYWWTHSSKTLKIKYERTDIMKSDLFMLELNKWANFVWNFQISFKVIQTLTHMKLDLPKYLHLEGYKYYLFFLLQIYLLEFDHKGCLSINLSQLPFKSFFQAL